MTKSIHHLQLRLDRKMKSELREMAAQIGITESDVVRGALYFGLPIFATMNDMQGTLIRRFVAILKKESRKTPKRLRG
jgi:hypothetical protein